MMEEHMSARTSRTLTSEERRLAEQLCPNAHRVFEDHPATINLEARIQNILAKLGDSNLTVARDPDDLGRHFFIFA